MLRRSDNTRVSYHSRLFGRKGSVVLHISKTRSYTAFSRIGRDEYDSMIARSASYPVLFGRSGEKNFWLFSGRWYWDNDGLGVDQVYALLVTRHDREMRRISHAQAVVAMRQAPPRPRRGAIPDDLKQYVWTRDQGHCQACGTNTELQFDHIIPVSMGGATSAGNLQLLCGPCNRRKGASLTSG